MNDNEIDYTYYEDLHVGGKMTAGPIEVTAADIVAFASKFDPQDFHLDAEKARDTAFGELVASGWHTASLTMRMIVDASPKMEGGMVGRSIERLNWLRPVRPGDKLTYEGEITDLRPSQGNSRRGVMRVRNVTKNQNGEPVLEMESVVMVPRRPV